MRRDFSKVLCEEPRHGWRNRHAPRLEDFFSDDEAPVRVRMSPMVHTKYFGEHLGPLKRFLRSRIGFRWDDVYSEISAVFPKKNAVLIHIYQHLWGYVARHCFTGEDGLLYTMERWGRPVAVTERSFIVYVDDDGYVRPAPRKARKQKATVTASDFFEKAGQLFIKLGNSVYKPELSDKPAERNPKWAHLMLPDKYQSRVIVRLIQQPVK